MYYITPVRYRIHDSVNVGLYSARTGDRYFLVPIVSREKRKDISRLYQICGP
jgi:hypothetical protein